MKLYVVVGDNPPILEEALVDRETAKLYYLRERGGNGFDFRRQIPKDSCRNRNIATSSDEAIRLWRSSLDYEIQAAQTELRKLLHNYHVHTFGVASDIGAQAIIPGPTVADHRTRYCMPSVESCK